MAKEINAEIQMLLDGGKVTKCEGNKFVASDGTSAAPIRSMESTSDPLEVGDVITIPSDYVALQEKLNDKIICYTMVTVVSADGSERCFRFFPNSLAKNFYPLDENKRRMAKVKTGGEVAAEVAKMSAAGKDVNDLMKYLSGKKIKVTNKTSYTALKFGSKTETQTMSAYTYDWA